MSIATARALDCMHSARWRRLFAACAALCIASVAAATRETASAATPPPPQPLAGFTQTLVAGGLTDPVVLAFAPGGDLWIGCQGGAIRVRHNGKLLPTPVITLSTDSASE